jgi:hypothetical protein
MLCYQIGSLVASLALLVPFVQDCESGPGPGPAGLPEGDQPCCEASKGPACEEPDVVACVCKRDTYCCEMSWDSSCISQAAEFCDAECS